MGSAITEARRVYERLWRTSNALLTSGRVQVDVHLRNKGGDTRRGITLVARPDAAVKRKVANFLRELAAICPGQHFYQPSELHVTVMAIIPGSESWREEIQQLPACQAALGSVLKNGRAFSVHFRGVTVSPDAVMIQGFPTDGALTRMRNQLRGAFQAAGLGANLDRRYQTVTAHLTVMRFSRPERDWNRLREFLQARRETEFGETSFKSLQLIWSNWYASEKVVRVLEEYPLNDQA